MPITVGVLGAFSVSGQGGTVDLTGRRQRSLTAILALEGGRIVSAARLIDLLWPGTEPADPINALQHQISRLRAAIGRDAVVRDEAGYGLDVTPDRVDALRFEQLATLGHDQLANGATADARAALHEGALAVARTRAPRLRRRGLGHAGVGAPRAAAPRCARGSDRGRSRRRPSPRGHRRDRAAHERASVPRTALGPADARAVPMRATERRAPHVPGRPEALRRGEGPRPRPGAATARGGDHLAAAVARARRHRRRRDARARRREPRRAAHPVRRAARSPPRRPASGPRAPTRHPDRTRRDGEDSPRDRGRPGRRGRVPQRMLARRPHTVVGSRRGPLGRVGRARDGCAWRSTARRRDRTGDRVARRRARAVDPRQLRARPGRREAVRGGGARGVSAAPRAGDEPAGARPAWGDAPGRTSARGARGRTRRSARDRLVGRGPAVRGSCATGAAGVRAHRSNGARRRPPLPAPRRASAGDRAGRGEGRHPAGRSDRRGLGRAVPSARAARRRIARPSHVPPRHAGLELRAARRRRAVPPRAPLGVPGRMFARCGRVGRRDRRPRPRRDAGRPPGVDRPFAPHRRRARRRRAVQDARDAPGLRSRPARRTRRPR